MFCPHCAEPNSDDVRYCRACGENLTVIAQALSKSFPVMLASKLDAHIARKNERLRRDGIMTGLTALFLLFSGIWEFASNPAAWLRGTMMLAGGLLLLLVSAWDLLAYKRSLSPDFRNAELRPAPTTDKLDSPPVADTTRRLDTSGSPGKK